MTRAALDLEGVVVRLFSGIFGMEVGDSVLFNPPVVVQSQPKEYKNNDIKKAHQMDFISACIATEYHERM